MNFIELIQHLILEGQLLLVLNNEGFRHNEDNKMGITLSWTEVLSQNETNSLLQYSYVILGN